MLQAHRAECHALTAVSDFGRYSKAFSLCPGCLYSRVHADQDYLTVKWNLFGQRLQAITGTG